jgi:predicted metal-binding transcription factor (methanogenesis marker protein 9)
MKRKLYILLNCALLFIGCSSKEAPKPKQNIPKVTGKCNIQDTNAPKWVCTGGDVKGYITAVGSAKPTPLDFNYQLSEAKALARDEIAKQIQVKVKNMFKNYMATTGAKTDSVEKATEYVSKQLTNQTLIGSKQLNMWIAPDKTIFVLVGVPVNANVVKKVIKSSLNNKEVLWQKEDANKAQKELDKAIEKEFDN